MSNYIDEFRNSQAAGKIAQELKGYNGRQVNFMEVCGTHTMAIFKYGLRSLLPEAVKLVSGPGCPVCVTPASFIDSAVQAAKTKDVIITTFGDLMRVPGGKSSLAEEKARGADVRILYSPLDSLAIARENPDKKVVFISIGFETTTPIAALTIKKAYESGIDNLLMLSANKTMPDALKLLSSDSGTKIDGYIYPGHVSIITGTGLYDEIAEKYNIPGVVAGFEPLDLLHALLTLTRLAQKDKAQVINEYSRVVKPEGNRLALDIMNEVFEPSDSTWRGLGNIPGSGMKIREKYEIHDACKVLGIIEGESIEPPGCLCGEVLKGRVAPDCCSYFGKRCTPEKPIGACMVSSEGTCAAYYRYAR